MIRIAGAAALALLVPGVLMLVLAALVLRGRRAAARTLAPPRPSSDGSRYWADRAGQRVEQRVTETREPAPLLPRPSARLQRLYDERIRPAIEAERLAHLACEHDRAARIAHGGPRLESWNT